METFQIVQFTHMNVENGLEYITCSSTFKINNIFRSEKLVVLKKQS